MDNILQEIKNKIDNKSIFQPYLFISEDLKNLNLQINNLIGELFLFYEVDKSCFYNLKDNKENLKIAEIRDFISKGNMKSSFRFQIFLIENISRLSIEGSNSLLKFLEEPGIGNIIFLTNNSESQVLETVLSRVVIKNILNNTIYKKDDFYYNMINNYLKKIDNSLLTYFFLDKNIDRQNYVDFLNTFLVYIKDNLEYYFLLEDIMNSLNLIEKNTVIPKYEIDKIILNLNYEKL